MQKILTYFVAFLFASYRSSTPCRYFSSQARKDSRQGREEAPNIRPFTLVTEDFYVYSLTKVHTSGFSVVDTQVITIYA